MSAQAIMLAAMERRGAEQTDRPAGAVRRGPLCRLLGASLLCLLAGVLSAAPAAAAPAWLTPIDLSVAGQSGLEPQVAVDSAGDAVAVWERTNGANEIVQSASRAAGGTWQEPVDLSVAGRDAFNPQVAVDPSGDAVAVWGRYDGANYIVEAASRAAGGVWQAPVDLSVAGGDAEQPQVAVDSSGDAVAVWQRYDGADYIVEAASGAAGGVWQAPVELSIAGQNAFTPQVGVDPAGDAIAVWARDDGANNIVQSASRAADGDWGAPVDLSPAGQSAAGPQVAVDPSGGAVAVWDRYDGANNIVQTASRVPGGAWGTPVDLSVAGQSAVLTQVAVDPGGDAVAVWERYDGAHYIVQSASRAAGGAWGTPVDLTMAGRDASFPQAALDPAGNSVAVWYRSNGPNFVIQAATRAAGGTWRAPVDLSVAGQNAFNPQVAVDSAGNAVTVWDRSDGSNYIVQAAGYDAAGPQLRSLSIPAGGVVGQPLSFSISPFDVWSAPGTTAWSFGDGAAGSGTSLSHTYAAPGIYKVTVTGSDVLGNTSSASGAVSISPTAVGGGKPKANARARRIVRVKGGKALLTLSCPAAGECAGAVKLLVPTTADARASRKHRHKPMRIGKATFRFAAGKTGTVKVPLVKKAESLIHAVGRKGLGARLGGRGLVGRTVLLKPVAHRHPRPA